MQQLIVQLSTQSADDSAEVFRCSSELFGSAEAVLCELASLSAGELAIEEFKSRLRFLYLLPSLAAYFNRTQRLAPHTALRSSAHSLCSNLRLASSNRLNHHKHDRIRTRILRLFFSILAVDSAQQVLRQVRVIASHTLLPQSRWLSPCLNARPCAGSHSVWRVLQSSSSHTSR